MKYDRNTFICFSPPVMVATFLSELVLAIYVLWKHGKTTIGKLIFVTLILLAIFQLAEYMVCEGALGLDSMQWSKIGFVAISFLPALGVHISCVIANKSEWLIPLAGYLLAIGFSAYFLMISHGIASSVCAGNYVIFNLAQHVGGVYSVYYYSTLIVAMALSFRWSRSAKNQYHSKSLKWLIFGYLSFMLPTALVNTLIPSTTSGVPSIMCGFAVIFAFVLVLFVLPNYLRGQTNND